MAGSLQKVAVSGAVIVGMAASGVAAAGTTLGLHVASNAAVALPLFAKMGAVTAMVGFPASAIPAGAGMAVLLAGLALTIVVTLVVAAAFASRATLSSQETAADSSSETAAKLYDAETIFQDTTTLQAAFDNFQKLSGLSGKIEVLQVTESVNPPHEAILKYTPERATEGTTEVFNCTFEGTNKDDLKFVVPSRKGAFYISQSPERYSKQTNRLYRENFNWFFPIVTTKK